MITIISGGQTGADRRGLEIAKALGFPTGGVAPKGYLTETGPDLTLRDFGLTEHASSKYPPRTWANVELADLTVWFGVTRSAGFVCTKDACVHLHKVMLVNPTIQQMFDELYERTPSVVNVAGNRLSKNAHILKLVDNVLRPVLAAWKEEAV